MQAHADLTVCWSERRQAPGNGPRELRCLGLLMLLMACQHDLDPLEAESEGGMRT
jgi:hypothetical protein